MNNKKVLFNPYCTKEQIVIGRQVNTEVQGYTYLVQVITANKDTNKEIIK